MGRHAQRPDDGPTADDDGNVVELLFDGEILDIVVTVPARGEGSGPAVGVWDDPDHLDDNDDLDDER